MKVPRRLGRLNCESIAVKSNNLFDYFLFCNKLSKLLLWKHYTNISTDNLQIEYTLVQTRYIVDFPDISSVNTHRDITCLNSEEK